MNSNGLPGAKSVAEQIELQASEWIERRDFGAWSTADSLELETWLNQSVAHRVAFLRLDLEWKRTERLAALRPLRPEPSGGNGTNNGRRSLRVAAAIAVLSLLGSLAASSLFGSKGDLYSTPVGGRKVLTLGDGSRIELNTNSALRLDADAHHRGAVLLRGEAYFQIAHDEMRPFVVIAGGHKVTDLGTKFVLRSTGNKLEVALVEGAAKVEPTEGTVSPITLKPGDVAFALPGSMSVIRKPIVELQADLGWRRGVVVFRHATLMEAADEFNRYNAQKIIIADPETAHLSFSATLPTHDTQTFVRILAKLFNTRHQVTTDGIVISR